MEKKQEAYGFADEYKCFLDDCKTEREAVRHIVAQAGENGFSDLEVCLENGKKLRAGDGVWLCHRGKAVALFKLGQRPLTEGMQLICTHIDSPRLDVRMQPFCEKENLTFLKTHYYGGIKKYQWVARPLALHGEVVKKTGEHIRITIGESEEEPVLYISDLPVHLSARQMEKTMEEGLTGEDMNVLCGLGEDPKRFIEQKYGFSVADLLSSELELVPAERARDAGLDRSMVAAYGQDDRVCAYAAMRAMFAQKQPEYSCAVIFADKEEVGSVGATGMNSRLLENMISVLLEAVGSAGAETLRRTLKNSRMLSGDVIVGFDPGFADAFETSSAARLGKGPAILKYSGHKGKKGTNDASAEYLAFLRRMFDDAAIAWQTGEMGRIDLGGGGTIAPFAASYGMEVCDFGVVLLSMHAPCELASKRDIYELYRAYQTFLGSALNLDDFRE